MQPLYFLENVTPEQLVDGDQLDRQLLMDFHLLDTFRDALPIGKHAQVYDAEGGGPDGKDGSFLAYTTHDGRRLRGINDVDWEWNQFTNDKQLWIGTHPDSPPTETDIRRRRLVQGTSLTLDENAFMIPACRAPDGSTCLPADVMFADDGNDVSMPVKPEFISYYNTSSEFVQFFFNREFRENCSTLDFCHLVVFIFGLNYRYSWPEQNLLRLIDTDNMLTIAARSISLDEVLKG